MSKGVSAALAAVIVILIGAAVVSLQYLQPEPEQEPIEAEPEIITPPNTIQNPTEEIKSTSETIPTMPPKEPVHETPKQPTQPILENIGFNLGKYDPATNKAGDILFVNKIGDHFNNQILLEFAFEVEGSDGKKKLPHPTYFLPLGTEIISPVQGKVDRIVQQEIGGDYEILIVPNGLQNWRLSFDHIINIKVKEGDEVNAGDVLGEVAERNSEAIPPELGWTELQMWESSVDSPLTVCPFMLLDDSIKADVESKMTQLADDWEDFIGKDVYAQEKWTSPGCLAENLKD